MGFFNRPFVLHFGEILSRSVGFVVIAQEFGEAGKGFVGEDFEAPGLGVAVIRGPASSV